ncbi:hypothetical protein Dimus_035827, partial [Dionaea muscipula]
DSHIIIHVARTEEKLFAHHHRPSHDLDSTSVSYRHSSPLTSSSTSRARPSHREKKENRRPFAGSRPPPGHASPIADHHCPLCSLQATITLRRLRTSRKTTLLAPSTTRRTGRLCRASPGQRRRPQLAARHSPRREGEGQSAALSDARRCFTSHREATPSHYSATPPLLRRHGVDHCR